MLDVEKLLAKKFPKLQNNKLIQSAVSKFQDGVIHQKEINEFIKNNAHLDPFAFVDAVFEKLDFSYAVEQKDIENIPSSGRVVIIANHPLGALDALSLIHLISTVRKDIKVVANDFLDIFKPLDPIMIHINNFKKQQKKSSIQKVYEALANEEAVIIFPSGEVSRATPKGVKDKKWHKGFLKFAKNTSSPILPVLIEAKNSKTFYSVSAVNKKLSMLLLPHEMFKQKGKSIKLIPGGLIANEQIAPKGIATDALIALYKKHLYGLKKKKSYLQTQKPVALPEDRQDIKKELKTAKLLGSTKDNKKIFLYEWSEDASSVLHEIGRLREISFRKVGEGVNKKRDIDKYDRYYQHIVLWDEEELEIVGAYRIGVCDEIVKTRGKNALYTTTLFEYSEAMERYLPQAIELGRSFVQPKYWGSRALDYLWQGIGAYLQSDPKIRYMFGPVSLSAALPKTTKDMIIYFYNHHFPDNERLVQPKNPYFIDMKDPDMGRFFLQIGREYTEDFKTLKQTLTLFDVNVPTLYKQYADLCEAGGVRFCAYNVDKEFADCVDSFIMVDIKKIKPKQKKRYFPNEQ